MHEEAILSMLALHPIETVSPPHNSQCPAGLSVLGLMAVFVGILVIRMQVDEAKESAPSSQEAS